MSASPGAATALLRMVADIDVRHILPSIHVPTLVLHRSGDEFVPLAEGRYLAERIPGARFVELPGSDHLYFVGDTGPLLDEVEVFLTGQHAPHDADRLLATVLFTDIVDSTRHAAEIGDRRWRDLLDNHDALVRRQIERFRGRTVKGTGDGVLATFDGPARAIRCACAIVEGARQLGVELRAGLHTGECEVRGDDLGGIAVHIGARVAAMAAPGEVLASSTVKDLVAGSGLRFADRGTRVLKGVPGEWQLYAAHT
jgi:class 3 adenylate cyclase